MNQSPGTLPKALKITAERRDTRKYGIKISEIDYWDGSVLIYFITFAYQPCYETGTGDNCHCEYGFLYSW
jgi:hypothetical protein